MKRVLTVLILIALAIPLFAEKDKNKDWQKAKLVDVKTQDMQNSGYSDPNSAMTAQGPRSTPTAGNTTSGPTGGSFSSAPTHFIIYNILIETEQEAIWATLSREVSFRPPDLKTGTDIDFKPSGPKFVEVKDSSGKKFEFKVTRREKKQPIATNQ